MELPAPPGSRCVGCQAPLDPAQTGAIVCPTCGCRNYQAPPRQAPGTPVVIPILVGAGCLLTLLAVAGLLLLLRVRRDIVDAPPGLDPGAPDGPIFPPYRRAPQGQSAADIVSWAGNGGSYPPCLAQVEGGEPAAVVGYAALAGGIQLVAVSARKGVILWNNPELADSAVSIACDGKTGILALTAKDFTARAIDAKSGKVRWGAKLTDAPEAVGFGAGCLSIRAADGKLFTLSLAKGESTPCPSAPAPQRPWELKQAALRAGDVTFSFSTVPRGTARVVVKATRGATTAWEQTLPIAVDSSSEVPPRFLSASGLVVAGKKPGTESMAVVLLDPATGRIVVEREIVQKENHGTFFAALAGSPPHVFFQTFGKLYAVRLPELEVLWTAGSMW